MPNDPPEAIGISYAKEIAESFRAAGDKIRARADLTAKTVGGLATLALSAVGIEKFADVFPLPAPFWSDPREAAFWSESNIAVLVMVGSFIGMAAVVGYFTRRLWRLSRPLILSSDVAKIDKLEGDEEQKVKKIYEDFADLNRVPSLRAYDARGLRFQKIAARKPTLADQLRPRADLIRAEVRATEDRAGLVVIRDRSSRAISDWKALFAFFAFVALVISFGMSADWLEDKHSEVTFAQTCAEARGAGATQLPAACDQYFGAEADEIASAKACAEARGAGATQLPAACDQYFSPDASEVAFAKSCGEARAAGATRLPTACDKYVAP
jgi:hypothetical protein